MFSSFTYSQFLDLNPYQEAELNNSVSLLFNRVESLKQQEEDIQVVISTLDVDKQRSLQELDALQNQIHHHNNHKLNLQQEIKAIQKQEPKLHDSIIRLSDKLDNLQQQEQNIQVILEGLNADKQRTLQELDTLQNNKLNLVREIQ